MRVRLSLYEARHDVFAYMRASSQLIIPFLCALGTYTHKKEKHCPLRAEKPVQRRKQGLNKNRTRRASTKTKTKTNWDSFKGDGLIQNTEYSFLGGG